jgi:hypothetical protein
MRKFFLALLTVWAVWIAQPVRSQDTLSFFDPAPAPDKKRQRLVGWSLAGAYAASSYGLYQLWYKDYDLESFHFFDDHGEWLQFDKAGHLGSAYYLGKWGIGLFRWTGMERRKAVWYGGAVGWAFLASVEVFDGFSPAWGFSASDLAYNTAGTGLLISQELLWDEQRVSLKFSHHSTRYPQYRPDQLGTSYPERLFKDYNGSTIWLSANVHAFLKNPPNGFPRWLSVSGGYGVDGLTGARSNPPEFEGQPVPVFERRRQYYISLDVDLTRIETRSAFLNGLLGLFGFVKFPAPAVELNSDGKVEGHWLYF